MALLFIIQMSVSIGAIAVSHEQQSKLMEAGWRQMSNNMKSDIQILKDCCGFKNRTLTPSDDKMGHPKCDDVSIKILNINIFCCGYFYGRPECPIILSGSSDDRENNKLQDLILFLIASNLVSPLNFFQLKCCSNQGPECLTCDTCYDKLENVVNHLLKVAGGIGLFFSFTLVRN